MVEQLWLRFVKSNLFFEYDRLENVNLQNLNFNGNTHKDTVYKAALTETRRGLSIRKWEEITGPELIIPLPFQCEVDIVEWGVQGHKNKDIKIREVTKEEQLYYILRMTFQSTEKTEEEEKRGTVKIVRRTPKKRVVKENKTKKKRKNGDSFETENQGLPPTENVDITVDDDSDDDLSKGSL